MMLKATRKSRPLNSGLAAGGRVVAYDGRGRPPPRRVCAPRAVLLLVALALPAALAAEPQLATNDPQDLETFFDRKEEGWFWYRDAAEEERLPLPLRPLPPAPPPAPPAPPTPPPVAPPPAAPAPLPGPPVFSVQWLRKKLPELREIAIDEPSEENVAAYMYAQKVMMDKAGTFATVWQTVLRKDPLLDENNRFPIGSTFKLMALREQDKARYTALRALNQKAGLFYFFRSDCDYCHAQTPLLYSFAREFNFFIFMVSLDGKPLPGMRPDEYVVDQGQARQMGISVVPAIVLAAPPKDLFVITQGYLTYHALQNRIYLAAEDLGLIPPDLKIAAHPMERGVLAPDVLADAAALGLENDPAKMVAYLRRKTHEALYGEDVPGPLPLNLRSAAEGFALAPETAIVPLTGGDPPGPPPPFPRPPSPPAAPPPAAVPPPAPETTAPEPEPEAAGLTGLSFGDGLDE